MVAQQLTERLIAVQVVGQQGHSLTSEVHGIAFHPPFGGIALAILLHGAILRDDELWLQDQYFARSGITSAGMSTVWL